MAVLLRSYVMGCAWGCVCFVLDSRPVVRSLPFEHRPRAGAAVVVVVVFTTGLI